MRNVLLPDECRLVHKFFRASNQRNGTMVDVGAATGGVSSLFADMGWTVHAFEPDSRNREALLSRMKGRHNVVVEPRAVCDRDGDKRTLYRSDVSIGISSLSAFHPSHVAADEVETVSLTRYCETNSVDHIDFLKIDTEGHDLFVLQGLDWERTPPRVIVTEFEDRKTVPLGYTWREMAQYLVNRGYRVLVSEWYPIVEYGTLHRWRRFRVFPSETATPDAWGNLIATNDLGTFAALLSLAAPHAALWRLDQQLTTFKRRISGNHDD